MEKTGNPWKRQFVVWGITMRIARIAIAELSFLKLSYCTCILQTDITIQHKCWLTRILDNRVKFFLIFSLAHCYVGLCESWYCQEVESPGFWKVQTTINFALFLIAKTEILQRKCFTKRGFLPQRPIALHLSVKDNKETLVHIEYKP